MNFDMSSVIETGHIFACLEHQSRFFTLCAIQHKWSSQGFHYENNPPWAIKFIGVAVAHKVPSLFLEVGRMHHWSVPAFLLVWLLTTFRNRKRARDFLSGPVQLFWCSCYKKADLSMVFRSTDHQKLCWKSVAIWVLTSSKKASPVYFIYWD